ncbi:MAG: cadherin-like domain-containing protein, partial [Candidatus Eisenbacteria bacterium]|nr:cadherin-like domain-containing protein [Candidatus Eisenbacteria bacterium]
GERYVPDPAGAPTVEWPIPWSPSAVAVVASLQTQLANTLVHDVSQPGSPLVLLRDHPALVAHMVLPYGMRGYRDNDPPLIKVTSLASYSRSALLTGYLATAQAYADAFPGDFCYWQYFSMNDGSNAPPLDSDMNTLLSNSFNGPGQRSFGVFRENLSDNGPPATAALQLLDFEAPGFVGDTQGHVLFQALTSWIAPFSNPNNPTDREPKTASGSPSFGALIAYRDFGTRYHEWYVTDLALTDAAIQNRFAFLPPYGTAAVPGTVPLADVPGIRAALWSRVSGWNRWLRDGAQPVADAFVVNAGSTANPLAVLANDVAPPDVLPSREAPPVGLAQVRAPLVMRVSVVSPAAHGSVGIAPGAQALVYTPDAGYAGPDTVSYTVTDDVAASASATVAITVDGVLGVADGDRLALRGPFPNPAAGATRFALTWSRSLPVRVRVHDVRGACVRDLGGRTYEPGTHEFELSRGGLAPGVYLVEVRAGDAHWVKRVLLR